MKPQEFVTEAPPVLASRALTSVDELLVLQIPRSQELHQRISEQETISFDPTTHTYSLLSREIVPSVTQVLERSGLADYSSIDPDVLKRAQERGTAVHLACELYDAGNPLAESVGPKIVPYLDAWKRFRAESRAVVLRSEHLVYHPRWRYAGTLDRVVLLNGRVTVLDLKTAAGIEPWVELQTAAYLHAWNEETENPQLRSWSHAAIRLRKDGTYRLHMFGSPFRPFSQFLRALKELRERERGENKP